MRLYDPSLGRFLEVDPVEGGSCNDYDYVCADPVNSTDIGGTRKNPYKVLWSTADPDGREVLMRRGPSADIGFKFGWEHIVQGHVGSGKRSAWASEREAEADIRLALAHAQFREPQVDRPGVVKYIYCEEQMIGGVMREKEVTVWVNYNSVNYYDPTNPSTKMIGITTAYVNFHYA